MPSKLTVGVVQSHTRATTPETLIDLYTTVITAKEGPNPPHLLLFPEAYLGGYPRTCGFDCTIGSRGERGRDQYLAYHKSAIDLGGDSGAEGDGTKKELERIAKESGIFLVVGLVEKVGGTLYCSVAYICPRSGLLGLRRKLMPTATERLVWGFGSAETLKAIRTTINGVEVTLAAAICWENYMPLLRYTIYSQHVSLYLAPTADARPTWLASMQHIATEGRCYVLSSNQMTRRKELPEYVHEPGKEVENPDEIVCRGGSCIVDPFGSVLAGPLWDEKGVLTAEIDMDQAIRGKMDLDVVGGYSR
ncbi:Nitrilase [Dactylella cylindrospora]|nr:Nitrilase [Dactylella cylindrospora]